jgi:hypothetical protein
MTPPGRVVRGIRRAFYVNPSRELTTRAESGECLEFCDAGLFQARIVIGVEIIEAHHLVSVRQLPPRDVHADEAGSAEQRPFRRHSVMDQKRDDGEFPQGSSVAYKKKRS